jgi:signal peptidase II
MRRLAAYAAGVAVLIGLDQAAKAAVEVRLPFEQVVPVMPFLSLFRTWNKGISFSLLAAFGDRLLIAIAVAVTIFVLVLAWRTDPAQRLARAGYAFIVAGALGNLIDRVAYGHVVDFILVHTESWTFAVFNLADAFISVGAALVVLQEVMAALDDRRKAAKN